MRKLLKTKFNDLLKNLLILLVSFVLVILFLEVLLHFFYPWTNAFAEPGYKADNYTGFIYQSNFSYIVRQPEFKFHFNTNSVGQRNEELGEKEKYRILVLGDSFTAGHGVELNQTFVKRIEHLLNGMNKTVEVINGGVSAYATVNEVAYLEKYGLALKPDMVILAFMDNDLEGNLDLKDQGYPIVYNGFLVGLKEITLVTKIKMFLSRHSNIYNLAWNFVYRSSLTPLFNKKKVIDINTDSFCAKYCLNFTDRDKFFSPTLSEFNQLRSITQKNNISLVVVMIPNKFQVYKDIGEKHSAMFGFKSEDIDYNTPNNYLSSRLTSRGFYLIDLLPSFQQEPRMLYYALDPHWTEEGHNFVAQIITEKLINKGFIS